MEKNRSKIELTTCPKCQATCVLGNDNDGQCCCANCGCSSFMPKKITHLFVEDYWEKFSHNDAMTRINRGGWTAYVPKKD